ncbi:MAG: hypothetical protein P4L85_22850 [Paludisphaera borealis]|uniref:hypothetical protein n=1 Tax=Paludisphaera borealis TaxID=1387353 RepID=UPI0028421841|nr:hypothetical protein [Paludisphaera borealis]MDR3622207.1 hypothetical protein [Paludisphaera borealis]
MRATARVFAMRICDESTALRAAQVLCHAASPALLIVALFGIARLCTTRAEMLIGTLAAVAASLSLATSGLVLGVLAEVRRR